MIKRTLHGDEWRRSGDRRSLLSVMGEMLAHQRKTGRPLRNVLSRLRLTYVGDPELATMPHGVERLRRAYSIYLAETRPGETMIPYAEGREHVRSWTGDSDIRRPPPKGLKPA